LKRTRQERVLAWDDFLLELFELSRAQTQSHQWRLSAMQEKMLMRKAMEDFPTFGFAREQTIQCALDAYGLVKAYQLKSSSLLGYKEDSDLFARALERFESECRSLNAFANAALIEQLLLMPNTTFPCQHLRFYGFDEWTPAQQSLIARWESLGVTTERMPQVARKGNVRKIMAHDASDEMYRAVLEAKAAFERQETMAIVVPKLQEQWAVVEHQLAEVFKPGFYFPGASHRDIPYNISSGASLDKQPIIFTLLETFKLLDNETPIQSWGNILHSPFIKGGMTEASERALFDMKLCDDQRMMLSLDTVKSQHSMPPVFAKQCSHVAAIKASLSSRTMRDWIVWLKEWIDAWGWAQERTLNSAEYQCVDTLHDVIPALYSLDALQSSFTFHEFLSSLYDLLKSTLFQTETQDKPIQVLGLLEAAGLSFDNVWVLGLTADNNPAKAMPHPLIPTQVQVQCDMPHSTPERELRVAQRLLERLIVGADQVTLSYAGQDDKGEPQLESPLISSYPLNNIVETTPERPIQFIAQARLFQEYSDDHGLALTDKHLKGGTAVLQRQAACPHAGYLTYRLKADSPEQAVIGLSSKLKGIIAHRVLERIWQGLKNRRGLIRLDEIELSDEIRRQVQGVLDEMEPALSTSDKLIESKRLHAMMLNWLTFEKTREDFEVAYIEEKMEIMIGELSLSLKMDRVDRVGDGQYFLIDYKTGDVSKRAWDLPRMDEPQLPLYATSMNPPPIAMAFGCLKKNKMGFEQMGGDEFWFESLNLFREDLEKLATEINDGYGAIQPKHGDKTCERCDLKSGCRLYTGGAHAG
jgi:probable DNA repair protein